MTARLGYYISKPDGRHTVGVLLVMGFYVAVIGWVLIHGFGYYRLPLEQRIVSPLHSQFRPSGPIGIRLALMGAGSFCLHLSFMPFASAGNGSAGKERPGTGWMFT